MAPTGHPATNELPSQRPCRRKVALLRAVAALAAGLLGTVSLATVASATGRAHQQIAFGPLANETLARPAVRVTARASSGLPIRFRALTPHVCVSEGQYGQVIGLRAPGTCTVEAYQLGNPRFLPAKPVARRFSVLRATQRIAFGPLANETLARPAVRVTARASSGLPVRFRALTTSVCISEGLYGQVIRLRAAGICAVLAYQPGSPRYLPARAVARRFSVLRATQRIAFGPLADKTLAQSPVTVTARASSGLPVRFRTFTTSVCISSGTYGQIISLRAAGTCTVEAYQPGSPRFQPAPPVSRSFNVVAPVLSNIETTPLSYQSGTTPVAVTSTLSISDLRDATMRGAVVSITSGFEAGADTLSFTNQSGITASYNPSSGVLTLSGNASIAAYQTAVRSVDFSTTDTSASPAARTVSFRVTDSDGATSNTESRTIDVSAAT